MIPSRGTRRPATPGQCILAYAHMIRFKSYRWPNSPPPPETDVCRHSGRAKGGPAGRNFAGLRV